MKFCKGLTATNFNCAFQKHQNRVVGPQQDVGRCLRALTSGSVREKETAVYTINIMARDDDMKLIIVDMGGIKPLVALLRSDNLKIKDCAIQALGNLGYNQEISAIIGCQGAIPWILHALEEGGGHHLRKSCFFALKALAYTQKTGVEIVRQGGINILLREMSANDIIPRRWASHIFARLAYHDCIRQFLAKEPKVIQLLVKLLSLWEEDTHSGGLIALAVCHLAYRKEHQVAITKAGAVPPLMQMAALTDTSCKRHATKGIANLSYNGLVRVSIYQIGCKSTRERLMCVKSEGHPYFEEAPPTLPDWNKVIIDEIVRNKGVTRMVQMLAPQEDDVCRRNSVCAVAAFACVPEHQRQVVKAGAIPRLVALLDDKDDVLIGKKAGWALTNLCCGHKRAQNQMGTLATVNILMEIMDSDDDSSKERAVLALANIAAKHAENGKLIIQCGGLSAVLEFMLAADNIGARNCAFALANLIMEESIIDSIVEAGVTDILLRLLHSDDISCVDGGLSALRNLSCWEAGKDAINQRQGTYILVDLLDLEGELRQVVIATLKNLGT